MKESILQRKFSILILKPEFMLLSADEQRKVFEGVGEVVGPNVLDQTQATLTRAQAEKLWENVRSYPWSGRYYDKMSGSTVTTIILEGQERAGIAKRELRSRFGLQISILTAQIDAGFEADIFHGSDPGQEKKEVEILNI